MKKSKRQKQIDLLEKLLDRVSKNPEIGNNGADIDWIHKKISQVAGGDIELDSGGLTKQDMIQANNMWNRHTSNHTV